jgi:hypothetical protein
MTGPSDSFPIGFSSEVSSPGSVLPVGSGAPDLVLTRLQFVMSAPWPYGRRQLVAGRWPCVTGLASYLSGCVVFCNRPVRFVASSEEEFLRALPVRSLHAIRFRFSADGFDGRFGGVVPPGKLRRVLVFAGTAVAFAATAWARRSKRPAGLTRLAHGF